MWVRLGQKAESGDDGEWSNWKKAGAVPRSGLFQKDAARQSAGQHPN